MGKRTEILLLLFLFALPLGADHFPEDRQAKGPSDSVLCGIDVYKTTITQATERLGKPDESTSPEAGYKEYLWTRGDVRVKATAFDHGADSPIYLVETWGALAQGEWGSTGKGLKLGGTAADLRRLYGSRYVRKPSGEIVLQWSDETTLDVSLNASGKIVKLRLMANEE